MDNVADLEVKCKEIDERIRQTYIDEDNKVEPIFDGIIKIEDWLKSKYKILWILKEPYDDFEGGEPSGGNFRITDWLISEQKINFPAIRSHWHTWYPIVYATFGIHNNLNWSELDDMPDNPSMVEILKNTAIININKLPGYTNSDNQKIKQAYNKYRSVLLNQIEAYKPNIIIGGNTLQYFADDLGINLIYNPKYPNIESCASDGKIYISAFHPANRTIPQQEYVDDIINVVKDNLLAD